jgi:N-acyl-D-amino-acid deacylase
MADYFRVLEQARPAVSYGHLLGHNTLRGSAMGGAARPAPPEALARMEAAARQGMAEGALGISTGLVYRPACFAEPAELSVLASVVREAGGILTAHIRSEGDGLLEALDEIIGIARAAAVPLQVSHLKAMYERNWAKLGPALERIEAARAAGLDVTADRYPYTAANTGLDAVLPRWALEGSRDQQVARLADPGVRARLLAELTHRPATAWEQVVIAEVTLERHRPYQGRSVAAAARLAGTSPAPFALDLLAAEAFRVEAIYHAMSESNLRQVLQREWVMIGSDSGCRAPGGLLGRGHPHPRTFGTFVRVLGPLVRDGRLFPLETAVRRMTWDPCRRLGLRDRGRLAPGAVADLVLFDPARVRDTATYEAPWGFAEGVHTVVVNGQVAVDQGVPTGVRAGRVVRRPRSA